MTTIAFIGLGNMGNPMAANLVKAGLTVQGFDLVPENLAQARQNGVAPMADAAGAVEGADTVITMLPAGRHVLAVYAEIAAKAATGTLFIDCSTVDVCRTSTKSAVARENSPRASRCPRGTARPASTVAYVVTVSVVCVDVSVSKVRAALTAVNVW